jgi:hypothetical protein
MHVVRHDDERMKIVLNSISFSQHLYDAPRNSGLTQPRWPLRRAIQKSVTFNERVSIKLLKLTKRKSTRESPRYENCGSRQAPMWKIAAIHVMDKLDLAGIILTLRSQAKACATGQAFSEAQPL